MVLLRIWVLDFSIRCHHRVVSSILLTISLDTVLHYLISIDKEFSKAFQISVSFDRWSPSTTTFWSLWRNLVLSTLRTFLVFLEIILGLRLHHIHVQNFHTISHFQICLEDYMLDDDHPTVRSLEGQKDECIQCGRSSGTS